MITDNIRIIPKPDNITWEEITELIHLAFKEKAERGLKYLATYQDIETTKKRVGDGICLVALLDHKLVGTGSIRFFQPHSKYKKWHNKAIYAYSGQLAVHPDYKKLGIGSMLQEERIKIAIANNADEFLSHTSIHAKDIHAFLKKFGFKKIELISGAATNYYAVRFRLPLNDGNKYSK